MTASRALSPLVTSLPLPQTAGGGAHACTGARWPGTARGKARAATWGGPYPRTNALTH